MKNKEQITELLTAWSDGDQSSLERLVPIVEDELRRIAHRLMQRGNANHTLQTTGALVNEAYLKLVDRTRVTQKDRAHFFAVSARIMRRILLNYARERGDAPGNDYEDAFILSPKKSAELIALDEALERLAGFDENKSRIVEMRYFGGLTVEETAEVLGIAPRAVSLHWRMARAWLQNELES